MSSPWQSKSIGALLVTHFSGAWGSEPRGAKSVTTVLRSTDIDSEGHVYLDSGAQRALTPREVTEKRLIRGDILLEASGGGPGKPVGRPAWFPGSDDRTFASSNFFKVLRPKPSAVDSRFLLWSLLHLVSRPAIGQFQQQTTGIINLKFPDYLKFRLSLPPIPEQRRIAEILDVLDEQIRATERMIGKSQNLRRGLLRDLIRRPGAAKQDGDISAPLDTFVIWLSGGTPSKDVRQFWGGSVPWLTPKDMKSLIVGRTSDTLMPLGVAAGSRVAPIDAVFIVVRGMILAHTFPVSRMTTAAAFNQDIKAVVPRSGILPNYLMYWFVAHADTMLRLVGESTHGTKKLDLPDLKAVPALFPSPDEQGRVLRILETQERAIDREIHIVAKLRAQKAGLLTDLLNGRVRAPLEAA